MLPGVGVGIVHLTRSSCCCFLTINPCSSSSWRKGIRTSRTRRRRRRKPRTRKRRKRSRTLRNDDSIHRNFCRWNDRHNNNNTWTSGSMSPQLHSGANRGFNAEIRGGTAGELLQMSQSVGSDDLGFLPKMVRQYRQRRSEFGAVDGLIEAKLR